MNWQNVYSQEDAQSAFLNFQRNIIESFNACCPIKNVKIPYRNRHDWINFIFVSLDYFKYVKSAISLYKSNANSFRYIQVPRYTIYICQVVHLTVLDLPPHDVEN